MRPSDTKNNLTKSLSKIKNLVSFGINKGTIDIQLIGVEIIEVGRDTGGLFDIFMSFRFSFNCDPEMGQVGNSFSEAGESIENILSKIHFDSDGTLSPSKDGVLVYRGHLINEFKYDADEYVILDIDVRFGN